MCMIFFFFLWSAFGRWKTQWNAAKKQKLKSIETFTLHMIHTLNGNINWMLWPNFCTLFQCQLLKWTWTKISPIWRTLSLISGHKNKSANLVYSIIWQPFQNMFVHDGWLAKKQRVQKKLFSKYMHMYSATQSIPDLLNTSQFQKLRICPRTNFHGLQKCTVTRILRPWNCGEYSVG